MIGHKLITKQTGAAGRPCNMARLFPHTQTSIHLHTRTDVHRRARAHAHTPTLTPNDQVLVMEKMNIIKEYYFAIMMDRASQVFHLCPYFYLCSLFRPVLTYLCYTLLLLCSYLLTHVHTCVFASICVTLFSGRRSVPSTVLCLAPS